MAINLGNVSISLRQFQEISSGKYNAGEVKLTSETGIDKVNNHVKMKFLNTTRISHEEVLAIKNAFVKALKSGGVDGYELNRIREELGLEPMKPVDRTLHERSIKPLSRQQIREILDRNAAAINRHEGAGTIRTSGQIHAGVSGQALASRAADRDATNVGLETRRDIVENEQINNIQAVLAGDVDFAQTDKREELLATAKQCLDAVLAGCRGNPRADQKASFQWTAPGGKSVVLSSGLTETGLVHKLEDIIVRLAIDKSPSREELDAREEFMDLATPEERTTWAADLANDPKGAFKARVVAVMIMHDRGIDDAATLSIVNHLKKEDAIAFATSLVAPGMNLEGDALRASAAVETALAHADMELEVSTFESAYIPALADQEFNSVVASNMAYHPERLPATFGRLVDDAAFEVRSHFGEVGYPDDAKPSRLSRGSNLITIVGVNNPNAPRITPEALRTGYIQEALNAGAERVLQHGVEERLKAKGVADINPAIIANALRAHEPGVIQSILAAPSPEEADAVLDKYGDFLAERVGVLRSCEKCGNSLGDWARSALAAKLRVPVESLSGKKLQVDNLVRRMGGKLKGKICDGVNKAKTDAEIETEYRKLVDKFVDERVQIFSKIDASGLSAEAKAEVKTIVLGLITVDYLDIDKMAAWAKDISTDKLAGLLAANAPKAQVFAAMREIDDAVTDAMRKAFGADVKAGKEIGQDEMMGFTAVMIAMVALSKPEMEKNLLKFLSDYVVGTPFTKATSITNLARPFMLAFEPKLASVAEGRFTSESIAPGNGPAVTAFREMIETRSGAPEDASPVEKAKVFADKVNMSGAKLVAATLATVASKNLVVDKGGHKQLDFESVNYQFNRDLHGEYKFYFPGVEGASTDYNTNRDRLVRFVTDDANATFATASEATKRKVGILMALLTQYTITTSTDAVVVSLALPGSGKGFDTVGDFNAKVPTPEFRLAKDADGNIKILSKYSASVSMLMIYGENYAPLSTNQVGNGSYQECEMEITLPKDNLETLASADWTQYNREAVNSYEGDVDGRFALIPPEFRFTGTVNISYHMHLNPRNQT